MMFFSKSKLPVLSQLNQMSIHLSRLTNHLAIQKINDIFATIFPLSEKPSPFNQIYERVIRNNQSSFEQLKQIVKLFNPQNLIGRAIIKNRDTKYNKDKLNLSSQLQKYMNANQSQIDLSIKKQMSIPLLETFFINLFTTLLNQTDRPNPIQQNKRYQTDSFYYYIVRNPQIHIIRQWIQYSINKPRIFERICAILEQLLYRYPIYSIKRGDNFTFVPEVLYTVYTFFQWRINTLSWQFLTIFGQYLSYNHKNFNTLFGIWLRLHISILKREQQYERNYRIKISSVLNKQIQDKNLFEQQEDKQLSSKNIQYLNKLSFCIKKILQKDIRSLTPQFAINLKIIKLLYNQAKQSFLLQYVNQICRQICQNKTKENKAMKQFCSKLLKSNQNNFDEKTETKIQNQTQFHVNNQSEQYDKYSRSIRKRMPRSIRQTNIWQKPIQPSQNGFIFQLVKKLSFYTDQQVKNQKLTQINLRFLCSYKFLLFSLLALIAFLYYIN